MVYSSDFNLNNPKTKLVWYCWAWRSAVSTWKKFQFVLSTSMLPRQPGWSCWWENVGEGVPGIWGWQWIAGYFRGPQMDLGGPRIFCPTSLHRWELVHFAVIFDKSGEGRSGLQPPPRASSRLMRSSRTPDWRATHLQPNISVDQPCTSGVSWWVRAGAAAV